MPRSGRIRPAAWALLGLAILTAVPAGPARAAGAANGFEVLKRASIVFEDGARFRVADFAGRLLVVNFWANWCANCLAEFASMARLQQAAGGPGVLDVVLVSTPENWDKDRALAHAKGVPFRLAWIQPLDSNEDAAKLMDGEARDGGVAFGLPVTYVVSPSGSRVALFKGGADWLSPEVRNALGMLAGQ